MSDSLIDRFLFNMDATLSTDFSITNIIPSDWTIGLPTGGAIQFDYVGDAGSSGPDGGTRLSTGEALTFDFDFDFVLDQVVDDYSYWLDTLPDCGGGTGGGTNCGQVAVSFQQLSANGEDSDLLASNWSGGGCTSNCTSIPEPASIALMGLGLLGMGVTVRRRRNS